MPACEEDCCQEVSIMWRSMYSEGIRRGNSSSSGSGSTYGILENEYVSPSYPKLSTESLRRKRETY